MEYGIMIIMHVLKNHDTYIPEKEYLYFIQPS